MAALGLGRGALEEGGDGGGGEREWLGVAGQVPELEGRGEVVAPRHRPPAPGGARERPRECFDLRERGDPKAKKSVRG